MTRKKGMSLSVLSSADSQAHSQACTIPRWGAWSAILIVGSFYLTQVIGMLGTEFFVGIGVGFVEGSTGDKQGIFAKQLLPWLLPFLLVLCSVQCFPSRLPCVELSHPWTLIGSGSFLENLTISSASGVCTASSSGLWLSSAFTPGVCLFFLVIVHVAS